MARFSDVYIAQYAGTSLFTNLVNLHYYWFMVNGLENKYSDIAHRHLENFKAKFYQTALEVLNTMLQGYEKWVYDHSEEGRIEAWRGYLEEGEDAYVLKMVEKSPQAFDLLRSAVEQDIGKDIDWLAEFQDTEFSYKAQEFLEQNYKVQTSDDEDALQYIKDNKLEDQYYEWAVKNHYFEQHYDLEGIYGNEWINTLDKDMLSSIILRNSDIMRAAYKSFKSQWGGWDENFKNVSDTVSNLQSVNIQDINGTMSTISLALNVAHNNGAMWEHLEIGKEEMDNLSNLDTSDWEKQLSSFAKVKYHGKI